MIAPFARKTGSRLVIIQITFALWTAENLKEFLFQHEITSF